MRKFKKINLKCEGVKLWGDSQTRRRYQQTLKRVKPFVEKDFTVLGIGGWTEFDSKLAADLGLWYDFEISDINYWISKVDFWTDDYAFMFETVEHLLNPFAIRFVNARRLFITCPYSPILQGKRHFHEMTPDQFYTLADEAGWKIIHYDNFRNYNTLKVYLSGIRPLIKLFMQIIGLSKIHFYVLERK